MDFFIDSGIAIGYSDIGDLNFHEPCKKFVSRYSPTQNNYHSIKYLIQEEIRDTEKNRLILRKKNILKLFPQRAKVFCEYIKDVSNRSHTEFNNLFSKIHNQLKAVSKNKKRKEHDAKFLASALIWAYEDKTLINPLFVTTDWWDICENRTEIYDFSIECLSKNSLKIRFVIDLVS